MKKILSLLCAVSMVLTVCGCGNTKIVEVEPSTEVSVDETKDVTAEPVKEEVKEESKAGDEEYSFVAKNSFNLEYVEERYNYSEDLTNWGVYDKVVHDRGANGEYYSIYIKYPNSVPTTECYANQGDDVVAMVSSATYIESEEIKDILNIAINSENDYLDIHYWFDKYWNIRAHDFVYTVDSQEIVQCGRYECCKNIGHLTFVDADYDGEIGERTVNFVAYSTFLSMGQAMYWMVVDNSEDQHNTETIAEYARKMAFTLVDQDVDTIKKIIE